MAEASVVWWGLSEEDQARFGAVRKRAESLGLLDISIIGSAFVDRLESFEQTLKVIGKNKKLLDRSAGEIESWNRMEDNFTLWSVKNILKKIPFDSAITGDVFHVDFSQLAVPYYVKNEFKLTFIYVDDSFPEDAACSIYISQKCCYRCDYHET